MIKKSIVILFLTVFGLWLNASYADGEAQFEEARIELRTTTSSHLLHVQLANTQKALRQGLMYREHMHPYHGMLFDFQESKKVSMWMKNTPMRLDMMFINAHGQIQYIAENTTPYSLDPITSPMPVRYVLEMPAGSVSRYDISTGNIIQIP